MTPSQALFDAQKDLLSRACGEVSVSQTDSLWDELLTFPTPLTKLSPAEFAAAAAPFCEAIAVNSTRTNNLQKFLWHVCGLLRRASKSGTAQRVLDALYFTRVIVKYLTEYLTAAQLSNLLKTDQGVTRPGAEDGLHSNGNVHPPLLTSLVRAVMELLAIGQYGVRTYMVHLEAVHLLLVMASTQLYTTSPAGHWGAHPFTQAVLEQTDLVPQLLQRLLQHYVDHLPLPPHAPVYVPPPAMRPSVLRLVRSAAVSVLWLPYQAITFLVRSGNTQLPDSPLGDTSLLLALVLLHHAPPAETGSPNPFRHSLQRLQDSDEDIGEAAEGGAGLAGSQACISYNALYTAMGRHMGEPSILLLYNLLHACQRFQTYVFVRGDLDLLIVPLLQQLYLASSRAPSQLYMLLIVILILSQDAAFAQNLHEITVPTVPWFKERLLQQTSLGSLMVAVLLRTAHRNLGRMKDVYLHTNMLAALTNLAPHFAGLSALAAQRLVSLLDVLNRKYQRLSRRMTESNGWESPEEEASVYVDFLRLVLEIINTVLVSCLPHNPELVYALLHRQDVLQPLQENPRFADLTSNISVAVSFFNERVEAAKAAGGWEWSVERVLDVIQGALRHWRTDGLKHFPELHFTYEEESSPEDFFVPYVWTLTVTNTTVPWNNQNISLFAPVEPDDDINLLGRGSQTGSQQDMRASLVDEC